MNRTDDALTATDMRAQADRARAFRESTTPKFIIPRMPDRTIPPRSRRTSVRHRALR